jgi:hypothetical protein
MQLIRLINRHKRLIDVCFPLKGTWIEVGAERSQGFPFLA